MMQMIGRGLRGKKAGGTETAYIVSFIDKWADKISWVIPEQVLIEEMIFTDKPSKHKENTVRLVSLQKIAEFAQLMDKTVDTKELENLEFIQRIPVGLYSFSMLTKSEYEEDTEKNYEILVFDNIQQAYADFVNELPDLFAFCQKTYKLSFENEALSDSDLDTLAQQGEQTYFEGCEKYPGYHIEDIKDILRYYAKYEERPQFIPFEEREKFDVTKLAQKLYDEDWGEKTQVEYLKGVINSLCSRL